MQYATLEDTVYLWFSTNDTSGSGDDGASAVYDVREGGASSSGAPVLSGSATLLSHANYPAGAYEVAIAATAGNGFAANKSYGVFCTLAVDSQNPTGFIGAFRLAPVPANAVQVSGDATAADTLELFAEALDQATGQLDSGSLADDTLTAAKFATDAFTSDVLASSFVAESQVGLATAAALDTVDNFIDTEIGALTTELAKVPKSDGTATWNATALASIQSEGNDALVAFFTSAAALVDQVWEETLADHEGTVGSVAEALADAGGAGASAADIADAVLDELLSGHTGAGSLGKAVADILVDTAEIGAAGAGLTALGTAAELAKVPKSDGTASWNATALAAINTQADLALSDYDGPTNAEMEARTLVAASYATAANLATVAGYLDTEVAAILAAVDTEIGAIQSTLGSLFTTAISESYRADGATGTVAQLLYEINQMLGERSIAGTTVTVKKVDGSTTAFTSTLDDDTSPTSITHAA